MSPRVLPRYLRLLSALTLVAGAGINVSAHIIPNDAAAQVFLKPEGQRLRMIVRVPMASLQDVDFRQQPDGSLDLEALDSAMNYGAKVWVSDAINIYEGDRLLPKPEMVTAHASLMSDHSFASYQQALAHVTGPALTNQTKVAWDQVMMDVLFEYPIQSDHSRFSIHADGLWRLGQRVVVAVRFVEPTGTTRAYEFLEAPGLVQLEPEWYQAALRFVHLGFDHILDGTDHLLFLLCLVIPFRRFRALVPIVTAFTVAHSITLIASAYNLAPDGLWFPPLIEVLIAASIVYMALENIVGTSTVHRRWLITFGFGLVHGFGFSFALRETLQFAGSHLLTSLLSFNIGVELGQLLMLAIFIPALDLLFRYVVAERMGTIIVSALITDTAWNWMLERWTTFRKYRVPWPNLTELASAGWLSWVILALALGGAAWFLPKALREKSATPQKQEIADSVQAE